MVTFSIPGDNDVANGNSGTPRSRPPLPFASKRPFAASSPYGAAPGSARRLGTPQGTPARRLISNRDGLPSSNLNQSSIATARNIFRASSISDSPPTTAFSPKLPQNTMTKLFAPGNTPDPNRKFRESTAQPTPRGMAAKATDKELFVMRIESPSADLTGEALAAKVPKDWNSKGSIYADQFLAHLCPPDFDDEQRRQFFCILDLRRLKYAADEIFSKKDWKLNIINFAKEFEKSRSIILLRYGLYEFQNVKPSKEILRRWRREHGLPDPEDDESAPTPSKSSAKSAAKKRKADDDVADNATPSLASGSKRRAMDKEKVDAPAPQPSLGKNKRKASLSDESESQPAKLAKPTSSASAALFGQIAEKHKSTPTSTPTTAKQSTESSAPKPSLFASKPTNGGLARSVFSNLKSGPSQAGSSSNIFGYLSDASSAKNSGVEADAESEADSDQEDSQEAGQSDEPSVAASGGADNTSQIGFGLLSKQPAPEAGLATASSSAPGTRESTPGRSLFDRVTKTSDGQLARADVTEPAATERSEPLDQTWNPSNTPIKFAPSNASKPASAFGTSTSAQTTSTFAPKSTPSPNMFGAAKGEQSSDKAASKETTPATTDKEANESDKENDSQAPKKSPFETKPTSAQTAFGSSLFSTKPAATEPAKESEAPKPATNLFGSAAQASAKPDTPAAAPSTTASLFGAAAKPAATTPGTSTPTPVMQSSTLFGANTSAAQTPTESTTPKPASMFGAAPAASNETAKPSSLFAPKSATNGGSLFGGASSAPSQPLFGAPSTSAVPEPEKKKPSTSETSSRPTPAPIFSFGASQPKDASQPAKPLFGAPRSPPSGTATNSLFSGSPMKQDEPSPAKRAFTGASGSGSAAPTFSFGGNQSQPSNNLFGAPSNATPNAAAGGSINFGGAASNAGTGSFNFSFGGAGASTSTISNPFSGGNTSNDKPASAAPASGGMFSFGGASTPSTGGTPSFQFGGAPSATPAAPSGGSIFGSQANSSTPAFGGTPSASGTPVFNFTSASPQPGQGNGSMFGSNTPAPAFGNLQPPAGGASTTGTNSPFSLGGGSSLATTPAGGTPEPTSQAEAAKDGAEEDGAEKEEQVNLTEGLEADEEVLHEVRAKALKFVPAGEKTEGDDKPKSKSPWSTRGVGLLRILKHKETNMVRLLLRAEPRGHIAINRSLLPSTTYKSDEKYVRLTTSNEKGDGLETWMLQVKTKEAAKDLAEAMEKNKEFNKK